MISPAWWRRWVEPHWQAVFAAVRKINPDLHIWYHTDGYLEPMIPDLIEIGISTFH